MNYEPRLIVLCGLPGTGKSTDTGMMRESGWHIYSTDDYLEKICARDGTNYDDVFAEYIKHATEHMNRYLQHAIREGQNVLWDQTNLTLRKRRGILARFPSTYYTECWYYPVTERHYSEWKHRLANRNGKTIPERVLNNMISTMETPTDGEGFDRLLIKETF